MRDSHILDILNLNTLFETVGEIPAIRDRYNYLEKALSKDATTPVDIAIRVILFAELIERVSLFGLFYLIMSFNKRQNTFKGLSNIVEATTKEEEIHGAFGVEIFNILKEENPYIGESSFIEDTLKNIFIKYDMDKSISFLSKFSMVPLFLNILTDFLLSLASSSRTISSCFSILLLIRLLSSLYTAKYVFFL